MKVVLLSLSALLCRYVNAQPNLTSANSAPVAGNSVTGKHGYAFEFFASNAISGANVSWDFSDLSPNQTYQYDIVNPSTTPYANSVSGETVAMSYQGIYDYNAVSTNSWDRIKSYFSASTIYDYTNPFTIIEYPCSYGSTFSDTYEMEATAADPFTRTGSYTATADGYGTLILPWGTITDVLRIRYHETWTDDYPSFGTLQGEQYICLYVHPGSPYVLLSVYEDTGSYTSFNYMQPLGTSLPNDLAQDVTFNIYPNPANSFVTIAGVQSGSTEQLIILNSFGQTVTNTNMTYLATNGYRYDVSSLAAGVYTFILVGDERKQMHKIVISN